MQIHGIKRQADANEVAHIDPEIVSSTIDMHVVCLNGKVELGGFFQDVSAQVRVRLETRAFAVCKICHVPLQLKIVNVDGREERSECRQRSQYPVQPAFRAQDHPSIFRPLADSASSRDT